MTKYKKNGKKLGVLGGMGPAAAAEFLRQLAAKCPAATDQEHPVVYMIGDCEIPDRSTAIFGKGESPAPVLERGCASCAIWGQRYWRCPAIRPIILLMILKLLCRSR